MTTKKPSSLEEKVDAALSALDDLKNQVKCLTDKVEAMEEMVRESNEILVAFSQSYYWTPEWQAREEKADEDLREGRYKQYDDVEDFIREMNQ